MSASVMSGEVTIAKVIPSRSRGNSLFCYRRHSLKSRELCPMARSRPQEMVMALV